MLRVRLFGAFALESDGVALPHARATAGVLAARLACPP